jgi:hypothetical protein
MTYVNFRILSSGGKYEIGNIADPYANLSASGYITGDTNVLRFYGSGYLSVDTYEGASGNTVFAGFGRLSAYDAGVANRFVGGDSDNYAYTKGTGASVTFGDGNNGLTDYGSKTAFRFGHGNSNLWLNGQKGVGVVGHGDNEVTFGEESLAYRMTLGDGNNMLDLNGQYSKVTAGDGANRFRSGEESKGNVIVTGDGESTFDLRGASHTVITGNGDVRASVASSNTRITVGNGDYDVSITGRGVNLTGGTGRGYVNIGAPGTTVNAGGTVSVWGSAFADKIMAKGNGTYDGPRTYMDLADGNDIGEGGDFAEIIGGAGADNLKGGKNSLLEGGASGDLLEGGLNSILRGGAGFDRMIFVGGQAMGGAGGDVFMPKAESGYASTDFNGKGLAHDVLDLSKLVSAMDKGTFMGAGVYGNTLQIEITSGGKLLTITLGNIGDDITEAGGFGGAASAGVLVNAPVDIRALVDIGKG